MVGVWSGLLCRSHIYLSIYLIHLSLSLSLYIYIYIYTYVCIYNKHIYTYTGFRVQGPGCRVQGSGFRVQGSGFRVQGAGFRVQGSGRSPPPPPTPGMWGLCEYLSAKGRRALVNGLEVCGLGDLRNHGRQMVWVSVPFVN